MTIDAGTLIKAYDDARSEHVDTIRSIHEEVAIRGGVAAVPLQQFSITGIKAGFCKSWSADKAEIDKTMFWLNMFLPKIALIVKGFEAMGDQLHKSECPKA